MNNGFREYGRYINGGLQIISPILLGVFIGFRLDKGSDFPLWTLVLSVAGIILGMVSFLREVLKDKNKK